MEPVAILIKILLTFTIIIDVLLCLFFAFKRKNGALHSLLLIYFLGILSWSVSILFILQNKGQYAAQMSFASAFVIALAMYFFTLLFPENKFPKQLRHYALLIPAILVLIYSFVPDAFFTNMRVIDGYYISFENGPYAQIYSLTIAYLLAYPIYILAKKYKTKSYTPMVRLQLGHILFGTTFFFVIALITNSLLPVFFNIYFFNALGPTFSLFFVAFIAHAINKHDFLGLRIIIQRSFVYTCALVFVSTVYITLIFLLEFFFHQITTFTSLFGGLFTTFIGIFTVPYIDTYLRKKTDKIFFKDSYNYTEAILSLSEMLNHDLSFELTSTEVVEKLKEILKTEHIALTFSDTKTWVPRDSTSTYIPIMFKSEVIGNIELKPKLSGEVYTKTDLLLLNTVSHQIATAYQRAKLYAEAQEHSRDLEKKVRERTSALCESQIQQRQMMHDISHSLQTPLTVLKSELGNLTPKTFTYQQSESLGLIIDDISASIYDFLKLAEIESMESEQITDITNISLCLQEVFEYIAIVAKEKKVKLTYALEPGLFVYISEKKVKELLLIVLGNAMKYIGASGPHKIHIKLLSNSTTAIIIIRDTGIGIPPDAMPQIFNRFYRAPEVKNVKGSGLGLSIAKSITRVHKGNITATSEYGKGTIFTITLPLIQT